MIELIGKSNKTFKQLIEGDHFVSSNNTVVPPNNYGALWIKTSDSNARNANGISATGELIYTSFREDHAVKKVRVVQGSLSIKLEEI